MNYFNINNSIMPKQPSFLDQISSKIERHLFHYDEREEISIHESTISNPGLFYSRLISFIFLTGIYVWAIAVIQQSLFENLMYLTMIGYFTAWLYFALAIQDYFLCYNSIRSKKINQFIQLFHEIAFCVEVPITLVFWGFLFKIVLGMNGVTTEIIVINGFLHSAPLVCLIVDFVFNYFSFHINHLPVIIVFDVIYLTINLIYSFEVKPIYGPIDWISVGSYIIAAASILITILIHFIGRVTFRKWKCQKRKDVEINKQLLEVAVGRRSIENVLSTNNEPTSAQKYDL